MNESAKFTSPALLEKDSIKVAHNQENKNETVIDLGTKSKSVRKKRRTKIDLNSVMVPSLQSFQKFGGSHHQFHAHAMMMDYIKHQLRSKALPSKRKFKQDKQKIELTLALRKLDSAKKKDLLELKNNLSFLQKRMSGKKTYEQEFKSPFGILMCQGSKRLSSGIDRAKLKQALIKPEDLSQRIKRIHFVLKDLLQLREMQAGKLKKPEKKTLGKKGKKNVKLQRCKTTKKPRMAKEGAAKKSNDLKAKEMVKTRLESGLERKMEPPSSSHTLKTVSSLERPHLPGTVSHVMLLQTKIKLLELRVKELQEKNKQKELENKSATKGSAKQIGLRKKKGKKRKKPKRRLQGGMENATLKKLNIEKPKEDSKNGNVTGNPKIADTIITAPHCRKNDGLSLNPEEIRFNRQADFGAKAFDKNSEEFSRKLQKLMKRRLASMKQTENGEEKIANDKDVQRKENRKDVARQANVEQKEFSQTSKNASDSKCGQEIVTVSTVTKSKDKRKTDNIASKEQSEINAKEAKKASITANCLKCINREENMLFRTLQVEKAGEGAACIDIEQPKKKRLRHALLDMTRDYLDEIRSIRRLNAGNDSAMRKRSKSKKRAQQPQMKKRAQSRSSNSQRVRDGVDPTNISSSLSIFTFKARAETNDEELKGGGKAKKGKSPASAGSGGKKKGGGSKKRGSMKKSRRSSRRSSKIPSMAPPPKTEPPMAAPPPPAPVVEEPEPQPEAIVSDLERALQIADEVLEQHEMRRARALREHCRQMQQRREMIERAAMEAEARMAIADMRANKLKEVVKLAAEITQRSRRDRQSSRCTDRRRNDCCASCTRCSCSGTRRSCSRMRSSCSRMRNNCVNMQQGSRDSIQDFLDDLREC